LQAQKQKEGPKLDVNDPKSMAKFLKKNAGGLNSSGSAMIFVDLKPKQPNGQRWDKRSQDLLASKWSAVSCINCLTYGTLMTSPFSLFAEKASPICFIIC